MSPLLFLINTQTGNQDYVLCLAVRGFWSSEVCFHCSQKGLQKVCGRRAFYLKKHLWDDEFSAENSVTLFLVLFEIAKKAPTQQWFAFSIETHPCSMLKELKENCNVKTS